MFGNRNDHLSIAQLLSVSRKRESLPFPPAICALPAHHSFQNIEKHEFYVKTQHAQKIKLTIPDSNLGAKSIERMCVIIFSKAY